MSSSFPEATKNIANQLYEATDQNSCKAMMALLAAGINDNTSALYIALMAAAPAIRFAASLIAETEEGEDRNKAANKEHSLVAALILGRLVLPHKDGVRIDFSPRNVLAAVEAASKVAGYDIKPSINRKMLESFERVPEGRDPPSLGYWDYVPDTGPDFSDFGQNVTNFADYSKTRH